MAKRGISLDASQYQAMMAKVGRMQDFVSEHVKKVAIPRTQKVTTAVMRSMAPRSKKSDTDKQSAKHKAKWAKTPPLRNTIISVVRDYDKHSVTTFTGVQNPWGNKANFDYHGTKNRKMVFWGNQPVSPRTRKKFRWMVRVQDKAGPVNMKIIHNEIDRAVNAVMTGKVKP